MKTARRRRKSRPKKPWPEKMVSKENIRAFVLWGLGKTPAEIAAIQSRPMEDVAMAIGAVNMRLWERAGCMIRLDVSQGSPGRIKTLTAVPALERKRRGKR